MRYEALSYASREEGEAEEADGEMVMEEAQDREGGECEGGMVH